MILNAYVAIAWAFVALFTVGAVVALALAIAASFGWLRIDAIAALAIALSCAGFSLAPLGYAKDSED